MVEERQLGQHDTQRIMPDQRQHRGPHPQDFELFGERYRERLCEAVVHYSWLLSHGYADSAALKLVGDHFCLTVRQRQALQRASCSDGALAMRAASRVEVTRVSRQTIYVDGFNVLITIEAALSGGVVLIGRDGAHRDLASVHGTYRAVRETPTSLELLVSTVEALEPERVHVLLDAPVSNSGRLATLFRAVAPSDRWSVELVPNPDTALKAIRDAVVATSDGVVMQECQRWADLPAWVIARHGIPVWLVDLRVTNSGGG